jgi:hypothetical protein
MLSDEQMPRFERELLRARLDFLRSPVPARGSEWTGVTLGADRGLGDVVLVRDEDGLGNVLIPVSPSSPGFTDWKRRGIVASVQRVMYRRTIGYYIRVRCVAKGADEAFASMALELAREVSVAGRPVGELVVKTLERHAEMFERASVAIPETRILGLIGELLVLRDLACYDRSAVENWSGPLGGHHDFEFPCDAIEVKTRLASSRALIHVHGVEQLDSTSGTRLWLVVNELVASETGESLADLLSQLLELGCSAVALSHRLGAYRLEIDDPRLGEARFASRVATVFEVVPGFPRLVAESFLRGRVPSGVESIEYVLQVAALSQWRVDDVDWRKEIARIASTS